MKATKFLILIAFVAIAMFAGCKDEPVAMPEAEASVVANQAEEAEPMKVFLNGQPVQGFSAATYVSTAEADMELMSVQTEDALYYFDQDAEFRSFCEEQGQINVYDAHTKLNIIAAKADELGLTEDDGAKGVEVVPQEMAALWYELFGYDIEKGDGSKVNLIVYVYEAPSPDLAGSSNYARDWFILPYKRTLGKMNGKISMVGLTGSSGATVFCHKTWFRGKESWFWTVNLSESFFVLVGTEHDKKFQSYYTVL